MPGSRIPLVLNDYQFKTSTILFPVDWMPTHVRWLLKNPYGETVYFVESPIDRLGIAKEGYEGVYHYTIWVLSENSGCMQVPAFAEQGTWTLKAQFYDKLVGFDFHKDTDTLYNFDIQRTSFMDDLNAPIYFILHIPIYSDLKGDIPVSINFALLMMIVLSFILLIFVIIIFRTVGK